MPLSDRVEQLNREIGSTVERVFSDLRREISSRLRSSHDEVLRHLEELSPGLPGRYLAHDDFTPHLQEAGVTARLGAFGELRAAAAVIDRARSQAEILAALLEQAGRFASRAAILLLRGGELKGWGGQGFGEAEAALRGLTLEVSQGSPWERLAGGGGAERLAAADCAALCSRLESPLPNGGLLVPLVLRDRIAAALYADTLDGDALAADALQLLTYTAALAIETLPFRERASTPTLEPLEAPEPLEQPESTSPGSGGSAAPAEETGPPSYEAGETGDAEAEAGAMTADFSDAAPVYAEEAAAPWTPAPPSYETSYDTSLEAPPAEPETTQLPELPELEAEPEPAAAWGGSTWSAPAAEPAIEPALEPAIEPTAEAMMEPTAEAMTEPMAEAMAEPTAEIETASTPEVPTYTAELPRLEPEPAAGGFQPQETVLLPRAGLRDSGVVDTPREPAPVAPIAPLRPVAPPPPRPAEDPGALGAAAGTSEVRPPSDVQGPGWAFATTRVPVSPNDEALHEEARRLARLLVSEIKLYNEEQVEEGRRNRDVYERLKEDIDRSRQLYEERVEPRILKSTDYFYQELVRILAAGDARALGI